MSDQLSMFQEDKDPHKKKKKKKEQDSEWGTFKDSLRAPVHRWFTYPAGFSYKAVQYSLKKEGIKPGQTIYDPFMGSGTTNLVAKTKGINSYGVEAHPMVIRITRAKMNWDIDGKELYAFLDSLQSEVDKVRNSLPGDIRSELDKLFPELLMKCFLDETLYELYHIRNFVYNSSVSSNLKNFLEVGLIATLRDVSIAATGWPYIAPNKVKITSMSKKGFETYRDKVLMMFSDIQDIKSQTNGHISDHHIIHGDSRNTEGQVPNESIDHVFTSPPYLNNFDYADRTRLEMYFTGEAKNWGEITQKVRTKLITCATTQVSRTDPKYVIDEDFRSTCPEICGFLDEAVEKLGELRKVKGGKKSYDLMVVGYFNDLFKILSDNYRVMKDGASAVYVLGDSAPYGVHIPTDVLIGRIAERIGFSKHELTVLRTRGGKWKDNPQRHGVMLQESFVKFTK